MGNNEEYKGFDDLRGENDQLPAVRGEYSWSTGSLHDASVGRATQSPWIDASNSSTATSENIENPSIEEEIANAKPYHCRFCTKKFFKSQALGGHMNRHRQEREDEQLHRACQLLCSKGSKFQMGSVNAGSRASPSQVQQQFCGIPAPSSFAAPSLVQSQFTGTQAQQVFYNQTPSIMRWNTGYPQSTSCGSTADMSASGCHAKTEDWALSNLQGRPQHHEHNIPVEMLARTNYEGNQELQHKPHHQSQPQPHHQSQPLTHHQPQHLTMEANAAYLAAYGIYPHTFRQGTSSTGIGVTEQSFNHCFQNPNHALPFSTSDTSSGLIRNSLPAQPEPAASQHFTIPHSSSNSSISATGHHFDLFSSISSGNQLLYSDPSPGTLQCVTSGSKQKSTTTINSIVNDDFSRALAPAGIVTGLAPHSQSQINAVAGVMHRGSNIINEDLSPNRD